MTKNEKVGELFEKIGQAGSFASYDTLVSSQWIREIMGVEPVFSEFKTRRHVEEIRILLNEIEGIIHD